MRDPEAVHPRTIPARAEIVAWPYVPRLAVRWLADPAPTAHRRVDGSVMFADVSGFTRLSERLARNGRVGAEEVVGLVSEVLTALIAEIEARGGDVLVFAGDALVVLFDGEEAERRAASTAVAIRRWFETRGSIPTSVGRVTLRVSIGVAGGPVDLVLAGDSARGIFVTGPTVSAMVRLERAADAGEILVDDRVAAHLDAAWLGAARDGGRLVMRSVAVSRAGLDRGAVGSGPGASLSGASLADAAAGVDLTPLLPAPLRRFLAAGGALESEHRLATIAFVLAGDLDDRLETEPAAVSQDLDGLYRAAATIAHRHGVTLLGTDVTSDGTTLFMAAGAPVSTGDDEERMLRALGEILAIPEAGRLRLRAGTNRGPVFAGDVGAAHRRTYTAMGDTTNLAARLAARAAPGELLATADVLARSAVEFTSEALEPFTPKGKRAPVIPYRVGRQVGRRALMPTQLPLAGRDDELALLRDALAGAARGAGRTVTIVGEAGSGKSRLTQELLTGAAIAGRLVARFTPADEETPYGGLRDSLRELAGIPESADPAAAGDRLSDWIDGLVPALRPWLPLLAIPFGASVADTPDVARLAPVARRDRLHAAMADLLGRALSAPAVLVLEDLHWADEASWALLSALAESEQGSSWLVLALQRPGARMFGPPRAARIELGSLDSNAVLRLALDAAGGSPLSDADLEAIVERAAGNPLFARELAVVAAQEGTTEALPDRLETLLTSRIDRLDGPRRALLRRAAVLGRTVDLELLDEVLSDEQEVQHDLAAWTDVEEFVAWVDPTRVRFRHDLVRDAAYEGLSHARRRRLHARLATAMERRAGDDTDEVAGVLALHFERGGVVEPAFAYARRAGDVARTRFANVDAAAQYRRALACAAGLPTLPLDEVAAVAGSLGDVAELAGRYDEAVRAYARARALLRASAGAGASGTDRPNATDALGIADLARRTGVVCERAGHYGKALAWYSRGRHRLEGLDGREAEILRIRLDLDRAGVLFRQGRYGACVRGALPAAAAAERIGERPLLAHAYYLLHAAYGDLGSPEVARYRDLALPIYEEIGDLVGQGNVLNNLGIEAYFEGRWDDALELYARSKAAKARAGLVANVATQSNNEAEILSDQGRFAEAEALLRDALRVWGAARYELGIALATSNLGRVAARAGRYDDGLAILEDAAGRFERIGARGYVDETRARIAECLALAGRTAEADAVAVETLARVRRETATSVLEAQLERTLGWCALQRGDPEAARAHLEASLLAARALEAGFEVALTLRAQLAVPGAVGVGSGDGAGAAARLQAEHEAATILAGLGVLTVAEPRAP
ncbi:MAG TPA: AAA family ATPase [Candidatus Limnocylindrales bacterium]|nr:AAA family ATPase [Candidatus Limnocylindrales bacterium]